ncbi:MAG: Gfo/Idh/MocA family oxidoreductase [Treponema sp.]|nr:Gfo/Idh/MocA family oxidoreductase [Treponema sp.]
MKQTRAAIVGLGRIASLLEADSLREKPCTHAGALAANPDCVLVGGCDTDEQRRSLFAARWGVAVYADALEMLRTARPDILVIATHPDSHYHYCRLAATSGVPVVICEKPLADTLSAARKIAALKKRGGITIITNHERRYSADYIRAKERLASHKLGEIISVRAVLYMGKNKRLVDVFWHDGTHLADAVMFLTGAALKHRKRWGAKLTASAGTAWLEGELRQEKSGSVPVVMEVGAGRDHLVFEIEFSCASGRLRIGNGIFEVWESAASPYAEKFRSLKKTEVGFEGPTGYFATMVADAVRCAREPGRSPQSSAACGLAVIEYLHSVRAWR